MSGGLAFVLDEDGDFGQKLNPEMVEIVSLEEKEDVDMVKSLIHRHFEFTGSDRAKEVLTDWESYQGKFCKVQPKKDVAVTPQKEDEADEEKVVAAK